MIIKSVIVQAFLNVKRIILDFWQKRQEREKNILVAGFCFAVIVFCYSAVFAPLMAYQSRVLKDYANYQNYMPYFARALGTYESLKASNQIPHNSNMASLLPLLSQMLVSEQLVPFGLKITMSNPALAVVTFKQAPFDALMSGVESLNKQGVFVVEAHIKPVDGKGIVEGSLTFSLFQSQSIQG